ncbi:MAG: hypothetical protein JNJ97_13430 [Alphaproteobacteria bacterium]|nr:hypothetical protein [Alphaproteobacteria bacterium]MCA0449232.1 hypothetical protein [Pseudomonadota bacterium]
MSSQLNDPRRPGDDIDKYDDRGLREMLRLAAEGVEGLLMRHVPGKESDIDREIFEDIGRSGCFRFKESTGAFAAAPIRFDAERGRLDVVMNLNQTGQETGIQFVRSGSDASLMRDYDPGSDYNRRLVELVSQVLGLGIVDEVVFGQKLPEASLLYLRPLPQPEESCERFIDDIVGAIGNYKPQPIRNKQAFNEAYARLVQRLAKSGVPPSRLNPIDMQNTLQQEMLRGMVKVEIWRKLWRWVIDCAVKVQDLRPIPAILSDKPLSAQVRDLEDALKRAGKIIGTHVYNASMLYDRAVKGSNFYVEAMPAILYIREAQPVVEEIYIKVNGWSSAWTHMPKTASIGEATNLLAQTAAGVKDVLSRPAPRAIGAPAGAKN